VRSRRGLGSRQGGATKGGAIGSDGINGRVRRGEGSEGSAEKGACMQDRLSVLPAASGWRCRGVQRASSQNMQQRPLKARQKRRHSATMAQTRRAGLHSRHGGPVCACVAWRDLFGARVHAKGSQRGRIQTFIFIPVINFHLVLPRFLLDRYSSSFPTPFHTCHPFPRSTKYKQRTEFCWSHASIFESQVTFKSVYKFSCPLLLSPLLPIPKYISLSPPFHTTNHETL